MKPANFLMLLIFTGISSCITQEEFHEPFTEDFNSTDLKNFEFHTTGNGAEFTRTFGKELPDQTGTKVLSFKIDPDDSAGAGRGPEIVSKKYTSFGTYAARIKIPDVKSVQPNAGVVVGYFTYKMDRDKGLSEIDCEWLIADPEIIYIGTWTGPRDSLRRIGRTINLAKGIIYNTTTRIGHNGERSPLTGEQDLPDSIPPIPGYDASSQFYTYGFDWYPDRLRWWMIHPETADTLVLWDYHGSQLGIPQNHSLYRLNFWRTKDWAVETNPSSVERPLQPYELQVDWMSYAPWKNKVSE
jgi:hypothetical protein